MIAFKISSFQLRWFNFTLSFAFLPSRGIRYSKTRTGFLLGPLAKLFNNLQPRQSGVSSNQSIRVSHPQRTNSETIHQPDRKSETPKTTHTHQHSSWAAGYCGLFPTELGVGKKIGKENTHETDVECTCFLANHTNGAGGRHGDIFS